MKLPQVALRFPSRVLRGCGINGDHASARRRDSSFHGGSQAGQWGGAAEKWAEATLHASQASQVVELQQRVVGIPLERALDPTIFCVLECGGMFMT